jgi:hypothetical protein
MPVDANSDDERGRASVRLADPKRSHGKDSLERRVNEGIERVGHLARLGSDWNSYGASPVSQDAIRHAQALLRAGGLTLQDAYPDPWSIGALPDGGVSITWRFESRELYVEIGDNGSTSLLLESRPEHRLLVEEEGADLTRVIGLLGQLAANR